MEGIESFAHVVADQKISYVVVDDLQSANVLGLEVLGLFIVLGGHLRALEGATHKTFQFLDVIKTILQILQLVDVLEQLLSVGVAADFDLLDHVDVGVLVLAHGWVKLYKFEGRGKGRRLAREDG